MATFMAKNKHNVTAASSSVVDSLTVFRKKALDGFSWGRIQEFSGMLIPRTDYTH